MSTQIHRWLQIVKPDIKIFLWVSLGIFLFILFYQPFSLEQFDFNNRLLVVAGMGAITFLLMILTRSFFPYVEPSETTSSHAHAVPSLYSSLILLALGSAAFAFYIRYVGFVEITFFVMFKVIFICLVPPVTLRLSDTFRELKHDNEKLSAQEIKSVRNIIDSTEEKNEEPVTFTSDNNTENLSLLTREVVFIKSADNYVEIAYREGDNIKTQLLRNTLKKIEEQLKPYPEFIRCHRICIVNIHHIENLENKSQTHELIIKGYAERLPVSRQYLLKVRESL